MKPNLFQAPETFEPIGVDGRSRSHVLREEVVDGGRFEVRDDGHAEAPRGSSPLLDGDQHERRPTPLELTAAADPLPECHPPRSRRPPPHHEGAREPRSPSLAAACEASSTQSRNVEGQAGAGGATPRRPACRWSSDKRSRATGSAGSSYYEGRSPRSARLGDRRRRIPSVFGQPTGSRAGARIGGTRNPPASGTEPDTPGRPLRWRIQLKLAKSRRKGRTRHSLILPLAAT